MRAASTIAVVTGALLLSLAASARAQVDASLEGEARGLFDAGASAYDGGRYDEALRYFQRSFELSGRAPLLYNIASAAERVREDALALRSYEEYLERVPDAQNRARVETRIAALREQMNASATRTPDVELTAERGAGGGVDPAPWVVVGVGAVVAIAGAVLLGVGGSERASVENPAPGAEWTDAVQAAYERAPALMISGSVLLPVGAALAAAGVVWALVTPSGSGNEELSVRIGPGSVGLTVRF